MLIRSESVFTVALILLACNVGSSWAANKCYSCASENMKENFLTRQRGPQRRINEPRLYDNMCDLDTWLIREKSMVECGGPCFKWQQIVNNSGVYSYATIRGCYGNMFDLNNPATSTPRPSHTECNSSIRNLDCLDQSTIIEHTCWCQGEYCNGGMTSVVSLGLISFLVLLGVVFSMI